MNIKFKPHPRHPVMLVDDEPDLLTSCAMTLATAGINNVLKVQDSREVLPILEKTAVDMIVLDLSMPYLSGPELLPLIHKDYPDIPIIVLTGLSDVPLAVECMKSGACDYMLKPVERNRFISGIRNVIESIELRREADILSKSLQSDNLSHPEAFEKFCANSPRMISALKYVEAIAPSSRPILIVGETGVGKELVANAIHKLSGLDGKFVSVNVAGVDDTVFSDTLFGHVKGAFTGGDQVRAGLVCAAAGGTLFLDEIGDLDKSSQVKLLRLLQEGDYYPMGSDNPKRSFARIIAATNRDLKKLYEEGHFRKDLYFRLCSHQVIIPPLRERKEDIESLAEKFIAEAAKEFTKQAPKPSVELISILSGYDFPGNVRELQGLIYHAVSVHEGNGRLSSESVKKLTGTGEMPEIGDQRESRGDVFPQISEKEQLPDINEYLDKMEKEIIKEALRRTNGNQTEAAQLLGLTRKALNKRIIRKNLET